MNRLDTKQRAQILSLLFECMGINAQRRMSGASKMTISELLTDGDDACADNVDANIRKLSSGQIECDEIWSFSYAKQKNEAKAVSAPEGTGDVWTCT
jgi:hypothetical protein